MKRPSPATQVSCTFAREIRTGFREADLGVPDRFDPGEEWAEKPAYSVRENLFRPLRALTPSRP